MLSHCTLDSAFSTLFPRNLCILALLSTLDSSTTESTKSRAQSREHKECENAEYNECENAEYRECSESIERESTESRVQRVREGRAESIESRVQRVAVLSTLHSHVLVTGQSE